MDYGIKTRVLRVMIAILEQPKRYTIKALADIYNVSTDTIKSDLLALRNAGLVLEYDKQYRYSFVYNQTYKQLKNLLHFSEEDQYLLMSAIDQVSPHTRRGTQLKQKLSALYDFRKLGHAYLRKPYLSKIDALEAAKKEKIVVQLQNYRSSNSNQITHRQVEPFSIQPSEDTLHAFDIEKAGIRHFRISRIQRVKKLKKSWENEHNHYIQRSDPFRIVDDRQVQVHLRFKVGAYNELVERFPLAKAYIEHDAEEHLYDLECRVNEKFRGLMPFILGQYKHIVEIIEPLELKKQLKKEIKKMQEKFDLGQSLP